MENREEKKGRTFPCRVRADRVRGQRDQRREKKKKRMVREILRSLDKGSQGGGQLGGRLHLTSGALLAGEAGT